MSALVRLTAKDAKMAAMRIAKATPGSRSVRKRANSGWDQWTQLYVKFDEPGQVVMAARALAAKCKAEGVRRYVDMDRLTKPFGGAVVICATSPNASVRLVEQFVIEHDAMRYRIDAWVAR